MDLGDKKLQKRNMATSEHQSPNLKSDWEYRNANISTQPMVCGTNNSVNICRGGLGGSSATSSISMMNSFSSSFWDYPNSQNLGSCNNNIEPCTSSSTFLIEKGVPGTSVGIDKPLEMDWNYPIPTVRTASFIQPDAGFHPQKLSQFPADSAFIERAAKFSCFNGENFSDNPFGISQSQNRSSKRRGPIQGPQDVLLDNRLEVRPQEEEVVRDNSLSVGYGSSKGSPLKNDEENLATVSKIKAHETEFDDCGSREEPPMAEDAGRPSPVEILGSKKRKRRAQNSELDQMKVTSSPPDESTKETKEKLDPSSSSSTGKANGKNTKDKSQALDAPKEDYIHVRARRGQATNSHSLAERVRREKISERMKFLQELVPGCSKVTGKAVMLDEIINYVQSLQRQVEFLSMKFAAVNPRLEFNFEGLLAKEMLQSKVGPSTMGFLSDMNMPYGPHPQLHPSQQGLVQLGITDVSNPSELLRRSTNSQLTALNVGYKELTHQMPNAWGDELHHALMNLGANPSFASQDLNGFGSSSHMKVEPR